MTVKPTVKANPLTVRKGYWDLNPFDVEPADNTGVHGDAKGNQRNVYEILTRPLLNKTTGQDQHNGHQHHDNGVDAKHPEAGRVFLDLLLLRQSTLTRHPR